MARKLLLRPQRWHSIYESVRHLIKLSAIIWKADNKLNEHVALGEEVGKQNICTLIWCPLAEFNNNEVSSEKSLSGLQVSIKGKRETPEILGLAVLKKLGL